MKKLVIIDGNGILHRAYHALPPLTDKSGEIVNAVYGFFSMFLNIIADQKPDYLSVCFDKTKSTIRQSMYAGYHAKRPELPDQFVEQIIKVHQGLEKMKVQMFSVDGYEADDVIGTISSLVQRAKGKEQVETIIVTGDRDLLQLVDTQTRVLMPITGLSKTQIFDNAKVLEKYGVTPEQFIDYKALIGDNSDGYPGVSGIGPKTAATLLQKFQTFENLYTHLGELSEKQALQLATDAEQAALAKKLATIVRDVPFHFELEECACDKLGLHAVNDVFDDLGFESLKKRLKNAFPNYVERPRGQMGLLE